MSVAFWLSSQEAIQHEPVVLYYRVENHAANTIEVGFGDHEHLAWLGLECIGPSGDPTEPVKAIRLPPGGLFSTGARVSPDSHFDGALVVQRLFTAAEPGGYTVRINARLVWATDTDDALRLDERQDAKVLVVSRTLGFEVEKGDPKRLSRIMDFLVAKAFTHPGSVTARNTAIEMLFSIPEAQALPTWTELLDRAIGENRLFCSGKIIDEAVRVGTPGTADLLAEIVWGRHAAGLDLVSEPVVEGPPGLETMNPGRFLVGQAYTGLINMHWGGDPQLKRHIEEIFLAHGADFPAIKGPIIPLN